MSRTCSYIGITFTNNFKCLVNRSFCHLTPIQCFVYSTGVHVVYETLYKIQSEMTKTVFGYRLYVDYTL